MDPACGDMRRIKVGLLGCGTVGRGVASILLENRELISRRLGAELVLAKVADINEEAVRDLNLPAGVYTGDAMSVVDDPDIPIVVELIGGSTVARELVLAALARGKSVTTANKALIAAHGREIFEAVAGNGGDFMYEASVGGCMPVIRTLRESLVANRVESIFGILNGTCNYILSKITHEGITFEEALAEAQENGFAEADPSMDVDGVDALHKLAICMTIAYGAHVDYRDIFVEGIRHVTPLDIAFAARFNYQVKLLAISKDHDGRIEGRVHPTMVPEGGIIAGVHGAMNAVMLTGDRVGDTVLYGQGAGMMPTGSAVVSDLVDLARNILSGAKKRVPVYSFQRGCIADVELMPMDEVRTRYYIRVAAEDRPGVLSRLSGVLGDNDISIHSAYQQGRRTGGPVSVVMLTHKAREADVQKALSAMEGLDVVSEKPVLIRIEDAADEDEAG
ncbi:MAG: homoserine dehydrogenase [Desulfatibacillaceae bacterium]